MPSVSQQYLPFTVLKHSTAALQNTSGVRTSQQYLPFTVLKRQNNKGIKKYIPYVATVLTVYGIET